MSEKRVGAAASAPITGDAVALSACGSEDGQRPGTGGSSAGHRSAGASAAPAAAPARVLLVDDDLEQLKLLSLKIASAGYTVRTASDGADALRLASVERPDVVLTDLKMGKLDGDALLDELARRSPGLPVIVMTAYGSIPKAIELTRMGAFGFLAKPVDESALLEELESAVAVSSGGQHAETWRKDIVTRSPIVEDVLAQSRRVARKAFGLLIRGPGGSGKSLLARAIHRASGRSGPLVVLDCAAVPDEQLESELLGSAPHGEPGTLRSAHGGTLLLKDVAKLPPHAQAKLVGAMQLKSADGSDRRAFDVRLIATTAIDLERAVERGDFREDLYYELTVVELALPPLYERREDVPLLVNAMLDRLAESGRPRNRYSPQAMEVLAAAPWPGNVRHLFNVVEKTAALASGPVVSTRVVTSALGDGAEAMASLAEAQDAFTRDYLVKLMRLTEGNVSKSARIAKRNRTDFYRLLARHGIDWTQFKHEDGGPE